MAAVCWLVAPQVASFMRLPGLGPKTARRLWQELGITTVDDLRAAAEGHQLRGVRGVGPKLEERILVELAKPRAAEEPQRVLLGRALPKLREVEAALASHPASVRVSIAGSARRFRETIRDLDLIATATDPGALIECGTTCAQQFPQGTVVHLQASNTDPSSAFTGWAGCNSTNGNVCTVTMSAARTVTATFASNLLTVTLSRAGGASGTVTGVGNPIDCGQLCQVGFPPNAPAVVRAAPAPGSVFTRWTA